MRQMAFGFTVILPMRSLSFCAAGVMADRDEKLTHLRKLDALDMLPGQQYTMPMT